MTIQVQGHVNKITLTGAPGGKICVHVMFDHNQVAAEGDECVVLYVPKQDASHWLVGRAVSMTAFALQDG